MAYNPSVNDRSGEIYANAATNAAAIQFEGMQQFGQSIGNTMESLSEGYAKAQENKMTSDYLDEMARFYSRVKGPDGQPLISAETLETFSKGSLGKKQGIVTPAQATYDQMLKNSYAELAFAQALARNNNAAANQAALRQPAPNQVPMGAGNPPPVNDTTTPSNPVFSPNIRTRPAFGPQNP